MIDFLVAVGPHPRVRGVKLPGDEGFTYDWRAESGSPENTRKILPRFEVLSLRTALVRCWPVDAHLVTYVLSRDGVPLGWQPRITKASLPWIREQGFTVLHHCFLADLDNPDHGEWTPALRAAFEHGWDTVPSLRTAGVYLSRRGWRAIQPLDAPLTSEEYEPSHRQWMANLMRDTLVPDQGCKDWTRLFRLPHVLRDGLPYRSPVVRTERMISIPAPAPSSEILRKAGRSTRPNSAVPDLTWQEQIALPWRNHIAGIAAAVAPYQAGRHPLFFALTGTLLERGVLPEQVPSICRAIAAAAGLPDPEKRETSSRDAVQRKLGGGSVPGAFVLAKRWPEVADAVNRIRSTRNRHVPPPKAALPSPSGADATEQLIQLLLKPPERLVLVQVECSLGKSHAMRRASIRRKASFRIQKETVVNHG